MIEYYGWISLSNSTYESDDVNMASILDKVAIFISERKMEKDPGLIKSHNYNGLYQLLFSGCRNHLSQDFIDILELYGYIAVIAQGSYGLLYLRNDENIDASNEFEVFVLSRGQVIKSKDPFLSPCIPTIEDGE
ncbi:hypothetical protein I2492_14175 [Budviciaceae bacterium CWB-B4]|uniref:Immunity protein 7 of polymorphic toxin system n=1 Tax=Limnobaculum xujianqingii TaxID=2738837 RepID=A0A9D7AKA5_9GAMM|nr:Imm7 family immunity protein [Limnobaculum xujianqingii]MBK5074156.1 hypothetical protein [Limnobaculum xujianqingii]MBK5177465.1 hypothetical protein [Limnobaculum xujianqingii]